MPEKSSKKAKQTLHALIRAEEQLVQVKQSIQEGNFANACNTLSMANAYIYEAEGLLSTLGSQEEEEEG